MKRNVWMVLSAACFLTAALLFSARVRAEDEQLASVIAPQVLRFHILANSNRKEDQELEEEVRSLLLEEIYEGVDGRMRGDGQMAENADSAETAPFSRASVIQYIDSHNASLARSAEDFIRSRGFSYPVEIQVAESYFPTKYYGDLRFPGGVYEAARVVIGNGKGHNWWCVLYPKLCFVDESWAVMPEESKQELEAALPDGQFEELVRPKVEIGWKVMRFSENKE